MKSSKKKRLQLDTNIVLDFIDEKRPHHNEAVNLILNPEHLFGAFCIAPHSFNDVYYKRKTDCKNKFPNYTNKEIEIYLCSYCDDLLQYFTVVGTDIFDTKVAFKLINQHSEYEDNLVVAAAERIEADYILTSDKQMIKDFPGLALGYEQIKNVI